MKLSILLFVLLLGSFYNVSASRLNVPRALLPYYAKNPVSYMLEAKDSSGECFYWKSNRPDIVSVEEVGCSDKVLITARSRHSTEQSATITATSSDGKESLTCDVRVDIINKIEVHTTTGLLFIEEPPAKITVNGFNRRGNEFSTLGSIPFEWNVKGSAEGSHPLRLVTFSESSYEVPFGIAELENKRKQGASILVDGIETGKATLSAKITDPEFSGVNACEVELYSVQKVVLNPSEELFVPVGAIINFGVSIIKRSGVEAVKLPSPLFRISIDDPSVCQWDEKKSQVIAQEVGVAKLTLVDKTFEEFSKGVFEYVKINVVPLTKMGHFIDRGDHWQIMFEGHYFRANKMDLSDSSLVGYGKTLRLNFKYPGSVSNALAYKDEL